MKLSKFIPKGRPLPSSTNFTIILEDAVGEYSPLKSTGDTTIRKIWDSNQVETILELEHPHTEIEDILTEIKSKLLNTYEKSPNYYFAKFDNETYSDFWAITFWCPHYLNWEKSVSKYLNQFSDYILIKWKQRGADDDYFDYLPSLTDMLFQLCELLGANTIWNHFLSKLISIEGEEVLDESLYQY